jgi:hypothetical protein
MLIINLCNTAPYLSFYLRGQTNEVGTDLALKKAFHSKLF